MDGRSVLPGEELVNKGLEDLGHGHISPESLLVSIGAHRLRSVGLVVPNPIPDADHRLYSLLADAFGNDAHSRYNGLVRTLISFEQAMECGK